MDLIVLLLVNLVGVVGAVAGSRLLNPVEKIAVKKLQYQPVIAGLLTYNGR
jgi:hypothetical protein